MKLILAVPTYAHIDPSAARSVRSAIMHAAKYGHTWLGDASPDRESFAHARNHVCKDILEAEDKDPEIYRDAAVMWVDSDIILPPDAITSLAHRGKDFICGVYFQRGDDNWPLIAHFNGKSFQWIAHWPDKALMSVDGCGFGCVLTSLRLLRAVKQPAFKYESFSEDFAFCLNAKEAGYQLYCDTTVLCGHLDIPQPITIDTYKSTHPEHWGGEGNERSEDEKRNVVIPESQGKKE